MIIPQPGLSRKKNSVNVITLFVKKLLTGKSILYTKYFHSNLHKYFIASPDFPKTPQRLIPCPCQAGGPVPEQ